MNRQKMAVFVFCLCVAGSLPAIKLYQRMRLRYWGWTENIGNYAGSLDRPAPHYDPAKKPSSPWLDPQEVSQPLASYKTYACSALNGGKTYYLIYLPPGYDNPANVDRRYPVIYWLHG